MRDGTALETNIYKWKSSYNVLRSLEHWGNCKAVGKAKINEKWNSHTIEIEFKNDGDEKNRAVKKGTEHILQILSAS